MPKRAESVPIRGKAVDSPIVGRWRGLAPNGATLAFNFMPDHRVTWESYLGTVHGQYVLAPADGNIEVDLYGFDHAKLAGERLMAIARVDGSTLIFEATSLKAAEEEGIPVRSPKAFGDEAMQLIRER